MSVAALLREVAAGGVQELRAAGRVPQEVTYQFRGAGEQQGAGVQKTRVRQVRSVRYGHFQAREGVLRAAGGKGVIRSQELREVVPAHANYAFDVVAAVGWASVVEGRSLKEVGEALQEQDPALAVPFSTLYDLKLRFLFYLEAMHRARHEVLREYLAERGGYTALVDGTSEGGGPVLLGVTEAEEEIVLGSWRIATENGPEVEACLRALVQAVGAPKRGLHDLSRGIREGWMAALPEVAADVCHFHFCRDVGRDLCEGKERALRRELRRHKLQLRLHGQRVIERAAIERAIGAGKAGPAALWRLLHTEGIGERERETVGREVIIAMHQWILDYASDGQGRGFPFDARVLYLHRRIVQAERCLGELVERVQGAAGIPVSLYHLSERLHAYVTDAAVVKAAGEYEEARALFSRLRDVLRLEASGKIAPLSDPYVLDARGSREVAADLSALASEMREQLAEAGGTPEAKLQRVVLTHLEEYEPQLRGLPAGEEGKWERTTNTRERQWRQLRRGLRKTHGRSKVGRELTKLPDALGLVPNLTNPRYLELVVGKPECVAECFAAVAAKAGSFATWKATQRPVQTGRLPLKEIRTEDLLERVTESYAREALLSVASHG